MTRLEGIQNTALAADKLVRMFQDGEIQLPEIQRKYVWPREKVRALLDSMYKGYPSGSILLWQTDRHVDTRPAAVAADAPGTARSVGEPYLLLDGQQRLTSLAAILRGAPIRSSVGGSIKTTPISIYFNMDHPASVTHPDTGDDEIGSDGEGAVTDHRIFRLEGRAVAADPRWIPVDKLFRDGPVPALNGTGIDPGDPNYQKYLTRLVHLQEVASYQYPVQILDKTVSYDEVTDIFVRLNSQGTKLRKADLALAQVTSRWKGAMDMFTAAADECRRRRFSLDEGFLIRCLISVSTGQSKLENVGRMRLSEIQAGLPETERGLAFAIDLLKHDAGIETSDVLPSPFLLVPLACLAAKHHYSFSAEARGKALRWAYAALVWGRYSGSTETMLDEDLASIRDSEEPLDEMIGRIRKKSGRLEVTEADLEGKTRRSSLFSIMYVLARKAGAKDWDSGLTLTVDSDRDFRLMHGQIFPRSSVVSARGGQRTPQGAKKLFADISNTVFLSRDKAGLYGRAPADYLPEIVEKMGEEALAAQSIPTDPSLWSAGNYEEFLAARRAALVAGINRLLAPPAPPPEAGCLETIAGGESDTVEFKSSMLHDYKLGRRNTARIDDIVREIVAFMNANGGTVYVGVSDDGGILGIDPDYKLTGRPPSWQGWTEVLANAVKGLGPSAAKNVSYEPVVIDGKTIAKITVLKGSLPAYVDPHGKGAFVVRQGPAAVSLNTKDANEYIRGRFPGGR